MSFAALKNMDFIIFLIQKPIMKIEAKLKQPSKGKKYISSIMIKQTIISGN